MVQVLPYDFPDSCVIIVTGKIMANEGVAFREIGITNTIFTRSFNAHIIAPLTEHRCQVYPEVVVIADGYDWYSCIYKLYRSIIASVRDLMTE